MQLKLSNLDKYKSSKRAQDPTTDMFKNLKSVHIKNLDDQFNFLSMTKSTMYVNKKYSKNQQNKEYNNSELSSDDHIELENIEINQKPGIQNEQLSKQLSSNTVCENLMSQNQLKINQYLESEILKHKRSTRNKFLKDSILKKVSNVQSSSINIDDIENIELQKLNSNPEEQVDNDLQTDDVDQFKSVDMQRNQQFMSNYTDLIAKVNHVDNSQKHFDMTSFVKTVVKIGNHINLSKFEDLKQSDPNLYQTIIQVSKQIHKFDKDEIEDFLISFYEEGKNFKIEKWLSVINLKNKKLNQNLSNDSTNQSTIKSYSLKSFSKSSKKLKDDNPFSLKSNSINLKLNSKIMKTLKQNKPKLEKYLDHIMKENEIESDSSTNSVDSGSTLNESFRVDKSLWPEYQYQFSDNAMVQINRIKNERNVGKKIKMLNLSGFANMIMICKKINIKNFNYKNLQSQLKQNKDKNKYSTEQQMRGYQKLNTNIDKLFSNYKKSYVEERLYPSRDTKPSKLKLTKDIINVNLTKNEKIENLTKNEQQNEKIKSQYNINKNHLKYKNNQNSPQSNININLSKISSNQNLQSNLNKQKDKKEYILKDNSINNLSSFYKSKRDESINNNSKSNFNTTNTSFSNNSNSDQRKFSNEQSLKRALKNINNINQNINDALNKCSIQERNMVKNLRQANPLFNEEFNDQSSLRNSSNLSQRISKRSNSQSGLFDKDPSILQIKKPFSQKSKSLSNILNNKSGNQRLC